jgi:integrase
MPGTSTKDVARAGLLVRNPYDLVELPKVLHKERRVLSPDEAQTFLKVAAMMPHGLIFKVALLTGMRPEESLALQWSDVDMTTGAAQIKRALVRHKKSWSFDESKTARCRRMVYLHIRRRLPQKHCP